MKAISVKPKGEAVAPGLVRVLIADDDQHLVKVLSRELQDRGYLCATAPDGEAALASLQEQDADVALIDLDMPKRNGFEVLAAIQEHGLTTIPVVLTGTGNVSGAVRAMKLGAFDFLEKPCNPELVEQSIRRAKEYRDSKLTCQRMTALAEQWEAAFDASADPMVVIGLDGRIIRCNRAAAVQAGAATGILTGQDCHIALCGNRHSSGHCPFSPQLEFSQNKTIEVEIWNGSFELASAPLFGKDASPWGRLFIARDVTERRRAAMEVSSLKQQIEFILGATKTGLDIIDSDFNLRYVDPAWQKVYGDPADRKCFDYFMGAKEPCPDCGIVEALRTGEPTTTEETLVREGNRPIQVTTIPFRNEEGELLFAEVNVDLTERRRVEAALRESEAKFRAITEAAQDAILMMDASGHISFYNAAAEAMFGWTAGEAMGKDLHSLLMPERYRPPYEAGIVQFRKTGHGAAVGNTTELTAKRKNGGEFPIEISLSGVLIGGEWHAVGMIRDITARRMAEETLRASEEKNRQIVDNIALGIAVISPDMRIIELNHQMRQWFPEIQTDERPICYRAYNHPPREAPCSYCPTIQTLADGQVHEATSSTPQKDGTHNFRIISSPIHDIEGRVVAAIEMVDDVTEKLRLEQELSQAQKLEAIGRLAAGIAHEINTPTQYVGDNIEFLQIAYESLIGLIDMLRRIVDAASGENLPPGIVSEARDQMESSNLDYLSEQIPRAIEQSIEGVGRVSSIVQAMKEFSHPGTTEKTQVDLNQCIQSTVTVSRNEWKYVADLDTDLDGSLPHVFCLPGEFNQVILNMIVNAAHAIGDVVGDGADRKGTITVSTRQSGDWAEVRISDTGSGIPKDVQDRIFDPFFTTKGVGRGTGQGLAIARNVVVDKHGGTVSVESEVGKGTTFLIRLPIAPPQRPETSTDTDETGVEAPVK